MLLGDGCLKPKPHTLKDGSKTVYYEYVVCHSTKQQAYIEHKLKLFHSLVGGKEPKLSYYTATVNGEKYDTVRFSRCHKEFRLYHRKLYCNNNKKAFTRDVLDYLNPQAIALWYMDDGGLSKSKRADGTVSSVAMRLYTYCTANEADIIVNYFTEVWNIQGKKLHYGKKDQWYISFNTTESKKLELLIHKHIVPSMMYKLPSNWMTRVPESLSTIIVEAQEIVLAA